MTDQKLKDAPDVIKFLLGEGTLDGFSFGEFPDNGEKYKRRYWWRKALREAWNTRAAPQPPVIEGLDQAIIDLTEANVDDDVALLLECGDQIETVLKAATLYAQGQTAQPQGDLILCRRVIKEPEHEGATGYEYFVPVKEAQPVDPEGFDKLVEMLDREPQHKPRLSALLREDSVFDKQPTEAAQGALFVLSTHIAPDDSLGQKCLETIRTAITQPEFEVVDAATLSKLNHFIADIPPGHYCMDHGCSHGVKSDPYINGWNDCLNHLNAQGYQIVRKKGGA